VVYTFATAEIKKTPADRLDDIVMYYTRGEFMDSTNTGTNHWYQIV
jgi:hypothetical protein